MLLSPVTIVILLLLGAALTVAAARFAPRLTGLIEARRAFRFRPRLVAYLAVWRRTAAFLGTLLREAAAVLEGEGWLLWLMALMVILLLAQ
ncbi:MAG: hypothetical protein ACE5E7_09355 [Anaerolineae bacterium]